jgi:hypothetical protein
MLTETTIGLGGSSYLRIVVKTIQAFRGIDVTRLMFNLELTNKDQASIGYPLWLGGRVELHTPGMSQQYVGQFHAGTGQPISVMRHGQETSTQLVLALTHRQLRLLDESRTGRSGVRLLVTFTGYGMPDGQPLAIQDMQPMYLDIGQSDWLDLIQQAGLKKTIMLELEAPDPLAHPDLAQALDYYSQAHARFREGEWRLAVESVRQSLAALVGKKPDEEDQESDIEAAIKNAYMLTRAGKVAYEVRWELVRQAAKFMADLGAHPEVAETRKPDAYAAIMIAGGLLHAFTAAGQ